MTLGTDFGLNDIVKFELMLELCKLFYNGFCVLLYEKNVGSWCCDCFDLRGGSWGLFLFF